MHYQPNTPLIVQSDRSVLVEVDNPLYEDCREIIARFAELEKSPEHIHTYRITPLSIWNACASGITVDDMLGGLTQFSKFEVPHSLRVDMTDLCSRYGRLKLIRRADQLILSSTDPLLIEEVVNHKRSRSLIKERLNAHEVVIPLLCRGPIKQVLVKLGWPVEDLAGYTAGTTLQFALRGETTHGMPFDLRDYQNDAVASFWAGGSERGGSGVLVLPCGAGKTIIGIGAMAQVQAQTLILATGITAARQWKAEILDKTDLTPEDIGEYSGESKDIRPITIATYQVLTHRVGKKAADAKTDEVELKNYPHLELFSAQDWGLIIYDEVHLLPAPVFRITAEIQARRRLGLTATLVREDGREDDVFSLIGPKKADVPWRVLERQGWIAEALCTEVRVGMDPDKRMEYAVAESREKFRIASTNPNKDYAVDNILRSHENDLVLIIGQYISQLELLAARYNAPLITGKTPNTERDRLYAEFRTGRLKRLVVSKVANFSIDLPDANVAIQVSGTFGSRQEEAQRLGRILRPKGPNRPAHFYSLVTRDTVDQEFGMHRQLFLTEQGYRYEIIDAEDLVDEKRVDDVVSRLIG